MLKKIEKKSKEEIPGKPIVKIVFEPVNTMADLGIGQAVYIRLCYSSKYRLHVIRDRVSLDDGRVETQKEFKEYKDFLRTRFKNRELFFRKEIIEYV